MRKWLFRLIRSSHISKNSLVSGKKVCLLYFKAFVHFALLLEIIQSFLIFFTDSFFTISFFIGRAFSVMSQFKSEKPVIAVQSHCFAYRCFYAREEPTLSGAINVTEVLTPAYKNLLQS